VISHTAGMQLDRRNTSVGRPLLALIVLIMCVSGCLPRQRFNKNCEWTQDPPRELDVHDSRDQQHLVQDAQLAEELATRYSDFKHKQLSGYEGHGGYLQQGQVTRGCMEKMFSEIERTHGVTHQQIFEARKYRDWRFDSLVLVSFVVMYLFLSTWVCRLLGRLFGQHGARFRVVGVVVSSVVASLVGLELLGLWAMTAEAIRVGNDHLGASRAARSPWFDPWAHQFGELFIGGILLFGVIAWIRHPARGGEVPRRTVPQGIILH
jgi:hypothetical protein